MYLLFNNIFNSIRYIIDFIRNNYLVFNTKTDLSWFSSPNSFFILSAFVNFKYDTLNNKFFSNYWKELPEVFKQCEKEINWVHMFFKTKTFNNPKIAHELLNKVNIESNTNEVHSLLESIIDLRMVYRVLLNWISITLSNILKINIFEKSVQNFNYEWLWPIFRKDLYDSLVGATSIYNLFYIHIFDYLFSNIPKQNYGLYLCENQGWSRALIHFWKTNDHGKLIGVAHGTINFWDLRFCFVSSNSD